MIIMFLKFPQSVRGFPVGSAEDPWEIERGLGIGVDFEKATGTEIEPIQ